MPNIQEVAVLAGVSTATVSHVLNGTKHVSPKLRKRVLKVAQDLNYQPSTIARSLITRRTKSVGMLVTDITNPFYPVLVRAAEDVLTREGYALVIGNSDGDPRKEEAFYRAVTAKWVDGLILITCPTAYPPAYLSRHNF
jgi:LacI family transcriptional regulator